jgi:hypothetical protein
LNKHKNILTVLKLSKSDNHGSLLLERTSKSDGLDCPISRTPLTDLLIVEFWSGPILGSLKTQGQSVMTNNLAFSRPLEHYQDHKKKTKKP